MKVDPRVMGKGVPEDSGMRTDSLNDIIDPYTGKVPYSFSSIRAFGKSVLDDGKSIFHGVTAYYQIIKKGNIPYRQLRSQRKEFARKAQKKFIDLNMDLQLEDKRIGIQRRMEENATLILLKNLQDQFKSQNKKIYWRFVKELEPPRIVRSRMTEVEDSKKCVQLTVRMCSEQIICFRDRYDRLLSGSLKTPKRVVDYVVFEKMLSDPYGNWRICGKINSIS